jgi:hypothetical protein
MVSTDKAGECVAAAAAVRGTLESAGMDEHDLAAAIAAGLGATSPKIIKPQRRELTWREMAEQIWEWPEKLGPTERSFIKQMTTYCKNPSDKQVKWISDIYERLGLSNACT